MTETATTGQYEYAELRARLLYLNDPEVRYELGEDARRAELAAHAAAHLLTLIDAHERLSAVLYPRVTAVPPGDTASGEDEG